MRQFNFQVDDDLLEACKTVAKASGMTMSELIRQALLALPIGQEGNIAARLDQESHGRAFEEMRSRVVKMELFLGETSKAFADLSVRIMGDAAPSALAERVDAMAKWAAATDRRLLWLEQKAGVPGGPVPAPEPLEVPSTLPAGSLIEHDATHLDPAAPPPPEDGDDDGLTPSAVQIQVKIPSRAAPKPQTSEYSEGGDSTAVGPDLSVPGLTVMRG